MKKIVVVGTGRMGGAFATAFAGRTSHDPRSGERRKAYGVYLRGRWPYVALFDQIAAQRGDGTVVLPFPIWREAFINDADLDTAQKAYNILNAHPLKDIQRQNFFEGQPGGHARREIVC